MLNNPIKLDFDLCRKCFIEEQNAPKEPISSLRHLPTHNLLKLVLPLSYHMDLRMKSMREKVVEYMISNYNKENSKCGGCRKEIVDGELCVCFECGRWS